MALYAIGEYRAHVSPHLKGVVQCRFTPTCSAYGQGAIQKYGFYIGTAKTIWRVARCGPWTKLGNVDPPCFKRQRIRESEKQSEVGLSLILCHSATL